MKTLVALVLVAALFIPVAAFADSGDDTHTDHPILVSNDVAPTDPAQLGTVAGPDKLQSGPYSDQRLDNMGQ